MPSVPRPATAPDPPDSTDAPGSDGRPDPLGPGGRLVALGLTVVLVLVVAVLIGGRVGAGRPDGAGAVVAPAAIAVVGRPMPDFAATTVDGQPVSLARFRGRPVWLTFGATWCSPCRAEAPDIQAVQDAAGADGVVVLAVYLSEDGATAGAFARRLGLRYRQIADPDRRLGSAYGVVGIPTHYFIDRSGVLRAVRSGGLGPERIAAEVAAIDR